MSPEDIELVNADPTPEVIVGLVKAIRLAELSKCGEDAAILYCAAHQKAGQL